MSDECWPWKAWEPLGDQPGTTENVLTVEKLSAGVKFAERHPCRWPRSRRSGSPRWPAPAGGAGGGKEKP
jgi:hypothetical protein